MARPRRLDDTTVLHTAMLTFWRFGFASTGIRELERNLGLKAPAIYHRFGSKEALFQAALQHYVDTVVTPRVQRHLQHTDTPLAGLRAFFDTTYDYISSEHPPMACLLLNTSLEALGADPAIASALQRAADRVRQAFHACLEQAKQCGQLDSQADSGALACVLYMGLQGLLVSSKVLRDPAPLRRQTDALFGLLPLFPGNQKGDTP